METIKIPDKGEAAQCKLNDFFLSISFIVSIKVSIFPLNMHMIIYVITPDDGKSILVHDVINLLYSEY